VSKEKGQVKALWGKKSRRKNAEGKMDHWAIFRGGGGKDLAFNRGGKANYQVSLWNRGTWEGGQERTRDLCSVAMNRKGNYGYTTAKKTLHGI